ncbi:MAG: transposase [Kiritimatiellae bacterium]|nr:transposase [Kiritimatiellia bacterium]
MDNHFHILLHVPEVQPVDDDEVKWRVRMLYGKEKYDQFEKQWQAWIEQGQESRIKEQLDAYRARMYDLSEFMKTFKQRFTVFYNANSKHEGPAWWGRYKSVLIEESTDALQPVAAYIDLNPVRAGKANDPKDYRWSGYGEAVANIRESRKNLCKLFVDRDISEDQVLSEYRKILYLQGEVQTNPLTGVVTKAGLSSAAVQKVVENDGKLSLCEVLRCKVRYFSDGGVIGSADFVKEVLQNHKNLFCSQQRCGGPQPMKYSDWGDLCVAKKLHKTIVSSV